MTGDSIPVAVVGAGNMGSNHARVYDELPGAALTEVVEPDPERAALIREQYDADILDCPDDITRAEAVTVSVPNEQHRDVAEQALRDGRDVLVEKPLATTIEDARDIVRIANEEDAVLQVGHIERFNPAVTTLRELLEQQSLISIQAQRLGPFNEHLSNENVIFDLMIHDLDVLDSLVCADINILNALGATPRSAEVDHAVAQFKFDNGVVGTTTASHVTNGKIRTLEVTTAEAYITLDYQEQQIVVQRRGTEQTTTLIDKSGYRTETITESPYIRNREPLKIELEHFLNRVRDRAEPMVSGTDGIRAIELATEVSDQITK